MLKKLLIILSFLLPLIVNAQRPVLPNTNPHNDYTNYNYDHGYRRVDSGYLTSARDTNFSPIAPMLIYTTYNSGSFWYWNMVKWQAFAAPSTNFVKYIDSTIVFVTPKQLRDSSFMHISKFDEVKSQKLYDSTQTYNDSIVSNNVIDNNLTGAKSNLFFKIDSVKNIGAGSSNAFINFLRGGNNLFHNQNDPPTVVSVNNNLLLNKQTDTLSKLLSARGSLQALWSFSRRPNLHEDTVNLTYDNAVNSNLKSFTAGFNVTNDSTAILSDTPYWNLRLPINYIDAYTQVADRGFLQEVTDARIGGTSYLNTTDGHTAAFKIGKHTGLYIEAIKSAINDTAYAINQTGIDDTVLFNSKDIQTPNVRTGGTPAFYILMDANGNWYKRAYIPSVSAVLDFPSTTSSTVSDLTVTVTGATALDVVSLGIQNNAMTATANYIAWVSAANTVTIRYSPKATEDPPSSTFKILVTPQ